MTSCVNTIATATLYSATAKTFSGAAYQSVSATWTYGTATQNTIAGTTRVKQGNENLDSLVIKAATVTAYTGTAAISEHLVTNGASNHYWDFM